MVKENPEILQGKGISTKKYAYITSLFTAVESMGKSICDENFQKFKPEFFIQWKEPNVNSDLNM